LFGESNTAAPEADRTVSTKLAGLVARARKEARLTNVVQYVDEELLRLAFRSLRKQAAPGVDGQSYEDYAARLDQNLKDLYTRLTSGRYQAPMIRRVYIPKANGKLRALGITTVSAYNRGTPAVFGFTGCHPPVPPTARAGIGRVVRAQVG
jgi:RNA-directed DNA polymerase